VISTSALKKLAQEHGTPLFIVDHDELRKNYATFKKHLPRVQAYYAVKANADPMIVKTLYEEGASFDVASMPEFGLLKIRPQLTVRDLMTHGATTISPSIKARDAVDVMVRKRLRALPVVGEKMEVLGIVTEWDIMRALLPHIPRAGEDSTLDDASEELAVRDVMSRSVLCVSEDMGLEEAANIMINKRVEQCPVVSEGVFTGMLTRSDIIRKLFAR